MEHHPLLNCYINMLKSIGRAMNYSIAITDTEKYIFYQKSANLDLGITPGTPLKPNTAIRISLDRGTVEALHGDASIFGVAYVTKTFPLRDEHGKIIGACAILECTQTESSLHNLSNEFSNAMDELSNTSHFLSEHTKQMDATSRDIIKYMDASSETIRSSDSILKMISQISQQTNLLALNAAVEAARAGQYGRGFGVIASEIRKLSQETDKSVKQISSILESIRQNNNTHRSKIEAFHDMVAEISESVNDISNTITSVCSNAAQLNVLADELMRRFN